MATDRMEKQRDIISRQTLNEKIEESSYFINQGYASAAQSPVYYASPLEHLGIELIDVTSAYNLNGHRFSIARYCFRAGQKNPLKEIEDMEKIIEYAQFEINRLKNEPISRTARKKENV